MIEIMTFELRAGSDVDEFLAADRSVQMRVAYQSAGLARRTTGRNGDRWLVLQVWVSAESAQSGREAFDASADGRAFMSFVDDASVSTERFAGLE